MTIYRSNCRSCGGQLYVVRGTFEASPMPLHRDGFSFTDAKHIATEGEVIHCSTCDSTLDLADCTVRCIDCDDRGWGHFTGNDGPEIQRCDCGTFPTDDDAQAAHATECGCGWGTAWYHQFYEVTVKVTVAAGPDQGADLQQLIGRVVAADLPGLVSDLPSGGGLMHICCAEAVRTEVQDEHPSRTQLEEFGVIDDDD